MLTGVLFVGNSNLFLKPPQILLPIASAIYESNIDDDDNPLWERYSTGAVPTIIAFEKGEIISRSDAKKGIGLVKSDLDSILKETNTVPS